MKHKQYPIGTVSSGTMRTEDLIPDFCYELRKFARQGGILSRKRRAEHTAMVREIEKRAKGKRYYASEIASEDLNETLFDALNEYAAPYFYFGSHCGDGADFGFWLTEGFADDFDGLKVSDTSEIPRDYRGEVMHVNDHGNVTLYIKTARKLIEVWAVV